MTTKYCRLILRAHGLYLFLASLSGLRMDVLGIFFASGPESRIVANAPYTGIGFIEAHGLAFLMSLWLLRVQPTLPWQLTSAAIGVLLGACNLVFWQIFLEADILWAGYLTTSLHLLFGGLSLVAGLAAFVNEHQRATCLPSERFPGIGESKSELVYQASFLQASRGPSETQTRNV